MTFLKPRALCYVQKEIQAERLNPVNPGVQGGPEEVDKRAHAEAGFGGAKVGRAI